MNMHTLRQTALNEPETLNWTPVEAPVTDATEEAEAQVSKGMTAQYLLRHAYRIGKIAARILIFSGRSSIS
jgi:hypothetical protein